MEAASSCEALVVLPDDRASYLHISMTLLLTFRIGSCKCQLTPTNVSLSPRTTYKKIYQDKIKNNARNLLQTFSKKDKYYRGDKIKDNAWVGRVACMRGRRNAYRVKPEGKRKLGRPRHR
jgi:hypothetical protein